MYDNSRTSLESSHGPYTIALSLSPSGSLSSTASGTTIGGQITFSNLRITSAGTMSIVASCSGMVSATSISTTVTNYVYTITTSTSNASPSINFSFTITALLKGEDGNAFASSITATLADSTSSLTGTLSATTSTGTATFSVYSSSTGSKILTVSASGSSSTITGSVTINVLTEILVISSLTPTVYII